MGLFFLFFRYSASAKLFGMESFTLAVLGLQLSWNKTPLACVGHNVRGFSTSG